jgi:hypothetical protein
VWDSVGDSVQASVWDSVGDSVRASVWDSVQASVWDSVQASVWASVQASVWDSVGASVGDSVWASVWDSVQASVWDSVGASVWASVGASVGDSVGDSVRASVRDSVRDSGYGQHDASGIGAYDFFKSEIGLAEETKKLTGLKKITENAGWFLPHKKICWVSERHNVLNRNDLGQLHKGDGPAVQYPDGWSIYALNGIRMKPEYVLTPASKLDCQLILKETNADIRRELIRKVGIERMLSVLPNKKLDAVGNYELYSIKLSDEVSDARYLKMLNPSIGVFHLEGVAPECDTVEKSLNWRNENRFKNAEVLT